MVMMKLTWIVSCLLVGAVDSLFAQNTTEVIAYINTYKEMAMEEMQRTGIPASIILAQGIHETEAGTSELVRKSNNHFGIKCKDTWTGAVVYHDDDARGECFRSYTSPLDSYKDHSDFLRNSPRYQFLFKLDPLNYEAWAHGLKKAGYATNYRYSLILIKLIQDYSLQQYTLIAMGKLSPGDEVQAGLDKSRNAIPAEISVQSSGQKPAITLAPAIRYPEGLFSINNTRVIYARSGNSLLAIADQYNVSLSRLVDFNDLKEEEVLVTDQLIFLQRKRKQGAVEYHLVQQGESVYAICQQEGIRMESLLELNLLAKGEEPETGEKIFLQKKAAVKPLLVDSGHGSNVQTTEKNIPSSAGTSQITHIVQTRETLYSISKRYGVDVEKIQQWNKLDSPGLRTGQELIIYKN
jgi:LysM repeat protein